MTFLIYFFMYLFNLIVLLMKIGFLLNITLLLCFVCS